MHRNSDDRSRQAHRRYLADPTDREALGTILGSAARLYGPLGVVLWTEVFWDTNDLIPDHEDLDVLADAVFVVSRSSEDLREAMEQVERLALQAEQEELDRMSEYEMDEDQRAPWWRRERFHDLDFNRNFPWKGGRLYSPARGVFVTVKEVFREKGKRRESRGYLLTEAPIQAPVDGVDSVLVDMAMGAGSAHPARSLSAWSLKRILAKVYFAPAHTRVTSAAFVTYPSEDPTDVVEGVIGAPARPAGGAPRSYPGRSGPMTGLWESTRRGVRRTMSVSRALGPELIDVFRGELYRWSVAEHPYRVRLNELRARYHEERGNETLELIWVGPLKEHDDYDGVEIVTWRNQTIEPDPGDEDFIDPYVETILDQLDASGQRPRTPSDWRLLAARDLHEAGTIVVEDWAELPEGQEIESPRRAAAEAALNAFEFPAPLEHASDVWGAQR